MTETYSTAFYAGVAIFSGFATGVFIYNAVEWYNVRRNLQTAATNNPAAVQTFTGSTVPLAPVLPSIGTADALFWLSIILAVFGGLIFIWSLISLFRGLYSTTTTVTTETKPPQVVYMRPSAANVSGSGRQVESTKTTTFIPTTTTANLVTPGSAEDLRFVATSS